MTRMAPANVPLTHIQAFVLGRLRDAGPMTSADFAGSRKVRSGDEWAKPVLNTLEARGLITFGRQGRRTLSTITDTGFELIRDLPPTPRRYEAMPDAEGVSDALTTARRYLAGSNTDWITIDEIANWMGPSTPLDAAEMEEARRIGEILTGRDLMPRDDTYDIS